MIMLGYPSFAVAVAALMSNIRPLLGVPFRGWSIAQKPAEVGLLIGNRLVAFEKRRDAGSVAASQRWSPNASWLHGGLDCPISPYPSDISSRDGFVLAVPATRFLFFFVNRETGIGVFPDELQYQPRLFVLHRLLRHGKHAPPRPHYSGAAMRQPA